jgi:hypothetical protein
MQLKWASYAETYLLGCLAGLAGGLAEIVWIIAYGAMTGTKITGLALGISAVARSVFPIQGDMISPIAFGVAVHMLAAMGLGLALAYTWRALSPNWFRFTNTTPFMLVALTLVWGTNFFVILPLISPYFVDISQTFAVLIPYPVSLISKLAFGLAAAAVLDWHAGLLKARTDTQSVC